MPTQEDIRRALAVLSALATDEADAPSYRTLFDRWWTEHGRHLSAAKRVWCSAKHPLAAWGELRATEITIAAVERYLSERGRSVVAATLNTETCLVKRVLQWACDRDPPLMPKNPLSRWRKLQERSRKGSIYREEHLRAIMDHLPRWAACAVLVLAYTGIRVGVVLDLRREDVDWETGEITIRKPDLGTKRRGAPRLFRFVLDELLRLPRVNEYLFASPRGGHYSLPTFEQRWRRACEAAGVRTTDGRAVIHHLRHGFVLRALEQWQWSAKQVGHAVGMTMQTIQRYGQISEAERAEAHERAEALIGAARASRRPPQRAEDVTVVMSRTERARKP